MRPLSQNSPEKESLFSAADFLASKKISFKIPRNLIMLPSVNLSRELAPISKKTYHLMGDIEIINDEVAVFHNFAMGAPLCVFLAEMAFVLGARNFIIVGAAGGLIEGLSAGDRLLCTGAFSNDGTSPAYCQEEYISAALCDKLKELPFQAVGPTWTTDAVFMESAAAVKKYTDKGCISVDMEACALFAFAKKRGAEGGAAFIVSDLLYGDKWQPAEKTVQIRKAIRTLTEEIIKIF